MRRRAADWRRRRSVCQSAISLPKASRQSLMGHVCVLRRIHTMRQRFGDRSAGGSVPIPSQLDRARTRSSTKIGSITININAEFGLKPMLRLTSV